VYSVYGVYGLYGVYAHCVASCWCYPRGTDDDGEPTKRDASTSYTYKIRFPKCSLLVFLLSLI